ncbi:DUF2790 domain-containing protein [Pseudomonas sp. FW300-N1A1]|uniref:DUF2790 domain-containing protein n=1 Tax=Pseudomonas sp. FW300-N1A1 TaxID=2075555 RepID=UPI000CD30FC8|nr:DUF2790 domain-containing protein [Pseudomonas sp. FW300-N1A1]POA21906.1 DUF2790 domain-containing protein [Pseudomonas sp. FW300-N1A1]
MNMRTLLAIAALTCTGYAGLVLADTAPSQAVSYHYGMALHVNKVLSMTEPTTTDCKVVTAEMTFIDNAGKQESIRYQKLSEACSYQN